MLGYFYGLGDSQWTLDSFPETVHPSPPSLPAVLFGPFPSIRCRRSCLQRPPAFSPHRRRCHELLTSQAAPWPPPRLKIRSFQVLVGNSGGFNSRPKPDTGALRPLPPALQWLPAILAAAHAPWEELLALVVPKALPFRIRSTKAEFVLCPCTFATTVDFLRNQ